MEELSVFQNKKKKKPFKLFDASKTKTKTKERNWPFKQDGRRKSAHLRSRMPRHQAGELQGLSLPDGVHPLGVSLLLDIAGVS